MRVGRGGDHHDVNGWVSEERGGGGVVLGIWVVVRGGVAGNWRPLDDGGEAERRGCLDEGDVKDNGGHAMEVVSIPESECIRRVWRGEMRNLPVANDADILDFSLGSHGD